MKITVRYFALLREQRGLASEEFLWEGADLDVGRLREQLAARTPALALTGRPLLIAVNREYAAADAPLRDGDEVALFPPVSGG